MLQVASSASVGDVRTGRFDALRIRVDDLGDRGPRVVARLLHDANVDELSGKGALDEDHSTVGQTTEAVPFGHDFLDVHGSVIGGAGRGRHVERRLDVE
ncbi:MAG: hypothetical protein RLZ86_530 [Actinomycetota bacterium]